jgi:hypothetical protein
MVKKPQRRHKPQGNQVGMKMKLVDLISRLESIESQSIDSALVIHMPTPQHAVFYQKLCDAYLSSTEDERSLIRDAIQKKAGVINHLLGFVHVCTRKLRKTGEVKWLYRACSRSHTWRWTGFSRFLPGAVRPVFGGTGCRSEPRGSIQFHRRRCAAKF